MEHKAATSALAALGQDTRLSVFRLLVRAGRAGKLAGDIAEALSLPGATLSFHLKALTAAGLVSSESSGRTIRYRADFDAMNALVGYLTENCCADDAGDCAPSAACGP
ncbi:ArsR/SmtB family transcription factor [Luteimonas terrae]|uniref:Transcriptional regulator n=1 Tax=Luteimonas terrae TaxID=1530191 RepID=A0A4R5U993_9GAMM|nr:metalloregulator ArsR/SmtB family transcription factor [Luteimonas terrae]TDK30832.1 transcriptional regulator [Luteimonas terrae]